MNEWIVNIFCGPCIIESLTYKLITQTSQVKWIEFAVICWLAEMRLVGYSDWSSEEAMTVYIDDAALKNTEKLPHIHLAISDHVGTLYQHLFLSNKPSRPSQSRWTGVANVCEFALSLSLCHGFLKGLFASLKKKTRWQRQRQRWHWGQSWRRCQILGCLFQHGMYEWMKEVKVNYPDSDSDIHGSLLTHPDPH